MDHHQYDIAIIGLGNAGSQLLLAMINHPEFENHKILVLDDFKGDSLDKTWSFWEKETGKWDHLLSNEWKLGNFRTGKVDLDFDMSPYSYKKLKSHDVIAFAKAKLLNHPNYTLVESRANQVIENDNYATIVTESGSFETKLVLDSRIPKAFFEDTQSIKLQQHFLGWVIKTESEAFDPFRFVMMDYRLRDPGTTSFIYILPYSKTEALVEFTYFSSDLVAQEVYETYLKTYLKEYLKLDSYEITATEQGNIPMSTYRFEQHHTSLVHKIGTAGGWVKPSTGYSFKRSEKFVDQLLKNYLADKTLSDGMFSKKFRLYDDIMLDVLKNHNGRGHLLFQNLYKNNPISRIFSFLDEETTFLEELKIMLPLTSMPFIKGFFKKLF
ncbi:lycopene beta-cyclase [Nonlabens sp. Hel1_33_55]|uniref:lycopene cyclase family protein n=1 Tax=Nonlabens sp. Hel1_33_55 TaxID=1336802 RepID=UPI000875C246|nr:lycopene cyclase family protein [Nonlabens sp. Hel1_33_55]SCY20437.1 lycopene beta-cyclase [Nonlabens sp. Hel1_33_55]